MADPGELTFDTAFAAEPGVPVEVGPGIVRLTAPNRGPLTFTGTNTYLIGEARIAIVDPGPKSEAHLEALTEAIGGRKVEAIVLTHTHRDHADLARIVQNRVDAPLLFEGAYRPMRRIGRFEFDPMRRAHLTMDPDFVVQGGDVVQLDSMALEIVPTPGHCANHICLAVADSAFLITGDHVMGWSTSVIADPDGALGEYLSSLDTLQGLNQTRYLPGHGGEIADGKRYAAALKARREQRSEQIETALAGGARGVEAVTARIYPELTGAARWAARLTVRAHLFHLAEQGKVRRTSDGWMGIGERWGPA